MQITLWTAEMFTAEETQIYIISLDTPPPVQDNEQKATLCTVLGRDTHARTHSGSIRFPGNFYGLFLHFLLHENAKWWNV